MDMLHMLLWLIYPYSVIVVVGMGLIWQINATGEDQEGESWLKKRNRLMNRIIIGFMALSFFTGIGVFLFSSIPNEPMKLFIWVKSLVLLEPDMDLIRSISILSRTHLLLLLTFLFLLSFSKYIKFLFRPHLILKKKLLKRTDSM